MLPKTINHILDKLIYQDSASYVLYKSDNHILIDKKISALDNSEENQLIFDKIIYQDSTDEGYCKLLTWYGHVKLILSLVEWYFELIIIGSVLRTKTNRWDS